MSWIAKTKPPAGQRERTDSPITRPDRPASAALRKGAGGDAPSRRSAHRFHAPQLGGRRDIRGRTASQVASASPCSQRGREPVHPAPAQAGRLISASPLATSSLHLAHQAITLACSSMWRVATGGKIGRGEPGRPPARSAPRRGGQRRRNAAGISGVTRAWRRSTQSTNSRWVSSIVQLPESRKQSLQETRGGLLVRSYLRIECGKTSAGTPVARPLDAKS